jgi:TfoX/Sxy family transcriptional regulator of competence genes
MACNEKLTIRIREALAFVSDVEEKKMFRGVTFLVEGKMCISVGDDKIMCRIDPAIHQEAIKRKASQTVVMKGREYKGYVYVSEEGIATIEDFEYWIGLSLSFNKKAKASNKRNK